MSLYVIFQMQNPDKGELIFNMHYSKYADILFSKYIIPIIDQSDKTS